jgi:hypothetical protein
MLECIGCLLFVPENRPNIPGNTVRGDYRALTNQHRAVGRSGAVQVFCSFVRNDPSIAGVST